MVKKAPATYQIRQYLGKWLVVAPNGQEMCQTADKKFAKSLADNLNARNNLRGQVLG